MKKYIMNTKIAIALISILAVSGCNKSLNEEPQSFVSPNQFFASVQQVEAAYAGSMNYLWNRYQGYTESSNFFSHDDHNAGGDLDISPDWADVFWRIHYSALLNINGALGGIKKGSVQGTDPATLEQLEGQGKFLRAYNYFMLVRLFGGVPLLTEDSQDPVLNPVGRSSVAEVYNLIEADLLYAAGKLPASWAGAPGKPTQGAAKSLLAKVYLTMATAPLNETANYAKAAAMANEVIQSGVYSLEANVADVFLDSHKFGSEVIWSYHSNNEDPSNEPQGAAPGFLGGYGGGGVQPEFEQTYPIQPRKNAYLFYEYNGLPYTDPSWSPDNRPYAQKYMNYTQEDFDAFRSVTNKMILRYADVLLIYAEASNMANGSPTAAGVAAANQVINRANGATGTEPLLTIAMTKDAFDKAIIQERSWELCFEDDRWFDIVRKRILRDVNPDYQANFSEDDYLFAIPELDLRLNKLLTQNPGYPTP